MFEKAIINRLHTAFPRAFINMRLEIIIHPKQNTYFSLENISDESEVKCKILEWLSREAAKSISRESQKYHLIGINSFLGTDFSKSDMEKIYSQLGNNCNRQKCEKFIKCNFDMSVLG